MISFEPLKKTLKEKSMFCKDLGNLMGVSEARVTAAIRGDPVPNVNFVENVCKTLNCSISDVIEWVEVAPEKDERFKIKWDIIPLSMYSLSLSLGKSRNAMRNARKLDSKLLMSDIKKIAELCNLNAEDLINEVQ